MTRLIEEHPIIDVEPDAGGQPTVLCWAERREPVEVCNHWRIEEAWWRKPVLREYFKLAGQNVLALVYRDGTDGTWHLERLYD